MGRLHLDSFCLTQNGGLSCDLCHLSGKRSTPWDWDVLVAVVVNNRSSFTSEYSKSLCRRSFGSKFSPPLLIKSDKDDYLFVPIEGAGLVSGKFKTAEKLGLDWSKCIFNPYSLLPLSCSDLALKNYVLQSSFRRLFWSVLEHEGLAFTRLRKLCRETACHPSHSISLRGEEKGEKRGKMVETWGKC